MIESQDLESMKQDDFNLHVKTFQQELKQKTSKQVNCDILFVRSSSLFYHLSVVLWIMKVNLLC